jgi:hypothetical protein
MKELSFEQMESLNGGEWCIWNKDGFVMFQSYFWANFWYTLNYTASMSYCIY